MQGLAFEYPRARPFRMHSRLHFFFQAEDGIRDYKVTGVQTCALPIFNPQRVFWELNKYLPDDAILAADSGTSADWFARTLKLKTSHLASLSGNLATMEIGRASCRERV